MAKLTPLQKARRKWILKRRAELGLCRYCGDEAYGDICCDRCRVMKTERQRAWRLRRKERGVCTDCKAPLEEGMKYLCYNCNIKKYGARECNTEGCYNIAIPNRKLCSSCIERKEWEKESCNVCFNKCIDCGVLFTATSRGKLRCDLCCIKHNKYKPIDKYEKECQWCGDIFLGTPRQKFCPDKKCSRRYHKTNSSKIPLEYIFERDRGRCHICHKKLSLKRKVPHPMAPTRDHIIPISNGGIDEAVNIKLACFICNSSKGNKAIDNGEQLLLFG